MPVTNIRQGTGVRIALKEQSAQGVPIEYFELLDADILRAEDVDINPNPIIIAQTGLTGSPYEQDEGAQLVGIEPTADLIVLQDEEQVAPDDGQIREAIVEGQALHDLGTRGGPVALPQRLFERRVAGKEVGHPT